MSYKSVNIETLYIKHRTKYRRMQVAHALANLIHLKKKQNEIRRWMKSTISNRCHIIRTILCEFDVCVCMSLMVSLFWPKRMPLLSKQKPFRISITCGSLCRIQNGWNTRVYIVFIISLIYMGYFAWSIPLRIDVCLFRCARVLAHTQFYELCTSSSASPCKIYYTHSLIYSQQ